MDRLVRGWRRARHRLPLQAPCGVFRRGCNPPGFSLIELVVALFVVALGMMGAVQMYFFGLDKLRAVRESAVAARVVQNEIETLRAMPFSALTEREAAPFVSQPPDLADLVNAKPSLTICAAGKEVGASSGEPADAQLRLQEVTVSLAWSGEHGRTIRKSVTTLVADQAPGGT